MDCQPPTGVMQLEGTISHLDVLRCGISARPMSVEGLGCAKTKSDLVVVPSAGRTFAFFCLNVTTSLKITGAVIPRNVFTQPGSFVSETSGAGSPRMSRPPQDRP